MKRKYNITISRTLLGYLSEVEVYEVYDEENIRAITVWAFRYFFPSAILSHWDVYKNVGCAFNSDHSLDILVEQHTHDPNLRRRPLALLTAPQFSNP